MTRIKLAVYLDLDNTPGTFHSADNARHMVAAAMRDRFSAYNPMVSIEEYGTKMIMTDGNPIFVPNTYYEKLRGRGPKADRPISNLLLAWWDHCEIVHNAQPSDFKNNAKGWHEKNFPECTDLPTYASANAQFKKAE